MDDLIQVDPALLAKWDRPTPRYTSYPTAPQFYPVSQADYGATLKAFDASQKPLSIYIHIPFCRTMCLFCGCSVVLNRKPERQSRYVAHLLSEIELVSLQFSKKRTVTQLHLGGGTPTSLTEKEFEQVMQKLKSHFLFAPNAEISIEIDPRTVYADQGHKLTLLKELGFNRVSFGVQDLDPLVQEAVKRRQSEEMTVSTYEKARALGFEGINIDLIYGLPHQTLVSFAKTADRILALKPDRIAFYSYAKIPWLKKHQQAISEKTLPSTEEKFRIYVDARSRFMRGGFTAIGMDHFALAKDPLSKAYANRTLMRNFQGYSVKLAEDLIGFGLTSIGFLQNSYFQNHKELEAYQSAIEQGHLPIQRGYLLSEEDLLRRHIISSLMCHFEVDLQYKPLAQSEIEADFISETSDRLVATPLGRLFIRLVASAFDAYLAKGRFSRAV